jgi:hypothetical protein
MVHLLSALLRDLRVPVVIPFDSTFANRDKRSSDD